jgi:transposase
LKSSRSAGLAASRVSLKRGAIVLRQKWSRGQGEARLANLPPCRIGMEAWVGAHHLSRMLKTLGHGARLMPAKYVRPYSKGQKNDYRDAEAIAEAVQRPTMKFVATKTADQTCPDRLGGSSQGARLRVRQEQ